jgi:hypothetical protein
MQPTEIRREADQAGEEPPGRARYRPGPQADGGAWRGPTDEAWTARILRGAPPPRASTGSVHTGTVPHS